MSNSPVKAAPRAYSYLRFSTPEQAKGDSLRRQTALADDYAKRHGLTLDKELNLKDLGVSAYRGDNAAVGSLGAFLQAVRDDLVPKGSLLLVEALDRISRKGARKAVQILEEIVEAGVTVVTLNDGKQWTEEGLDGADFLLAILLFMRGNDESATKAKRLKASWVGKRERAARGEIQTGSVPAWINVEGSAAKDSRNAKLSLIPDRAQLVERIFAMTLDGCGKHTMAETFNKEGIPTWGGSAYWHQSYLFKILRSPTVTGRFVPHVESHNGGKMTRTPQAPIEGYYPRVIDDQTFERVQSLITARRATVRSSTVASIVAGLARCPKCGGTMTRIFKGAGPKAGIPKLVCAKAKAGGGCEYHLVKLPEVERALSDSAERLRKPPLADEDLAGEIAAANEELGHLGEQIETLVDAIERSPSEALSKRLAEREAARDAVRAELKQLKARAADAESRVVLLRAKRLANIVGNLKLGTVAAVNAALRECVESVTIDYDGGLLRLAWRHGPRTELRYGVGSEFEDLDAA
jgi:DNA invertase Pin-like site-specific DNA recombinase